MILIFLGPPGAGKGTQAKRLAKERGWPHLSTGDMFRFAISQGTEIGKKAKAFMDQGQLVPDEVTVGVIRERIQKADCKNGFLLDGFPRTIPQAEVLDEMLSDQNRQVDRVVLFEMSHEPLVKRLSGRRTCPSCSAMYHLESQKPSQSGICDTCGAALIQRDDDQPEVIQKRLEVYERQTAPLASFYSEQGKLRTIDADQPQDRVYSDLKKALE